MLHHLFTNSSPEGSDATKTRASNWNAEHNFDGGAAGQAIIRDTTATYGASWSNLDYIDAKAYGAIGNGVADDTSAIQSALDAAYSLKLPCFLPGGTYKITSQLRMYATASAEDGIRLIGAGPANSLITWAGSSGSSPIRIIAGRGEISHLGINNGGSGWVSGIEYDGDAAIGRSTHGTIRNVFMQGNSLPGDGIALGRSGFQADMCLIDHVNLVNLTSGRGIVTLNGNALTTTIIAPTITNCHQAIHVGATNNVTVVQPELDDNDINFVHDGGAPLVILGGRSENAKRAFWCNAGSSVMPVTWIGYWTISADTTRPVTTGNITSGQTTLTLSTAGFVSGDQITIAGAGAAGVDLNATILAMTSLTSMTITPAALTTVTGAAVTLNGSVTQRLWSENRAGPYVHINCNTQGSGTVTANVANGQQVWIGNYWEANLYDPYGGTPGSSVSGAYTNTHLSNVSNSGSHVMRNNWGETTPVSFTNGDSTPSVLDGNHFVTANTGATTISAFDDGYNGQEIHVLINDANTSIGGGSVKTSTGAAVATQNGRTYTFIRHSGNWYSDQL